MKISTLALFCILLLPATNSIAAGPETATRELNKMAFTAEGKGYIFDTGALRGTLRLQGKSQGLLPVFDDASGTTVARSVGLFSPYRLLDAENRYGKAVWEWASTARLLDDGAVEVSWSADDVHPLDMKGVYRWADPHTLDLAITVTPRKSLRRFEVFLASYFEGFAESAVYVKTCPQTGGKPGFLEAKQSAGRWQMFPRDAQLRPLITDGRWQRPPNPVDWNIMPPLAGALALRRDAARNLTALIMAPPKDCFAVSLPYNDDPHRSIYLSLFGQDLAEGTAQTARARLTIDRNISDEQAIERYRAYLKQR